MPHRVAFLVLQESLYGKVRENEKAQGNNSCNCSKNLILLQTSKSGKLFQGLLYQEMLINF